MRKVIVLFVAVAILLPFAIVRAEETSDPWIDEIGFTFSYGIENNWVNPAPNYDFDVKRATLVAGKYLDEGKKWKLDSELQFSYHSAKGERSASAKELGANLVIKREFPSTLPFVPYIGMMGGLGWLIDAEDQPKFGDSGMTGKFGPVVGLDIPLDQNLYLRGEYRLTHTSDPWNSDVGRNFDEFIIGITFVF